MEYHADARSLLVDFGFNATVVSSVSGVTVSRHLVVVYVDKDARYTEIDGAIRRALDRLGLPQGTPAFATAVREGEHVVAKAPGISLLATVGLDPPACISPIGATVYQCERPRAGTINVLGVVEEGELTLNGLLDLYRTLAEAKAVASTLLPIPCRQGVSVGTVSDAVAVAARVSHRGCRWAGPATQLGWRLTRLVFEALLEHSRPRCALDYAGISLDQLVEDAVKLYSTAPVPGAGSVGDEVARLLRRLLADPNVSALVLAAVLLDRYGAWGAIPGLSQGEYAADSKRIVADELLASALAVYANGFRGLLAVYWADRVKERLGLKLAGLPMFLDDTVSALIGAALSKLYDRLLGTEP